MFKILNVTANMSDAAFSRRAINLLKITNMSEHPTNKGFLVIGINRLVYFTKDITLDDLVALVESARTKRRQDDLLAARYNIP